MKTTFSLLIALVAVFSTMKTKAQTKPAKQPPAPLEEWIEDDVAMPPATKIRVERFSQSRSPYERFQEEETKTSTDPEGDDEI